MKPAPLLLALAAGLAFPSLAAPPEYGAVDVAAVTAVYLEFRRD